MNNFKTSKLEKILNILSQFTSITNQQKQHLLNKYSLMTDTASSKTYHPTFIT